MPLIEGESCVIKAAYKKIIYQPGIATVWLSITKVSHTIVTAIITAETFDGTSKILVWE